MKVLLVYPPRQHFILGVTPHAYVEADAGFYPPIGLMYIAGYLEKFTDCQVRLLDAYTEGLSHDGIKAFAEEFQPDVVGIYFSTYYLLDGIITARTMKQIGKRIITVAGGPHTAFYPRETIKVPEVDYVMVGESENSFAAFMEYLKSGKAASAEGMPNVLGKESPEGKMPVYETIADLDALPFPARHLGNYRNYRSILTKHNPMTTVITSRGCPFRCYFCSNIESGKKVRYRSPKNVVDELAGLVSRYAIRDFLFFDELFTSNRQRTLDICDEITGRGLKIRWHCRSRIDVLDFEMARKMRSAGCRLMQFGIETGSQRLQKVINKNLDLEKARQTLGMVYGLGIYTYADFMIGLPTETEEEAEATISFAQSLKLDYAFFGMFHPAPGSVFYEQGLKEGRFGDFWREFVMAQEGVIGDYSWSRRDREKHHQAISRAYKKFYLRPSYAARKFARADSLTQVIWQAKSALKVFSKLFRRNFE